MIDKELFKLIGGNKKYIFIAVLLQAIGLIANVAITGSVCYAVYLLTENAEALKFIYPLSGAAAGIIVRYICSRLTGDIKDKLGRSVKKDLRERVYNKIVKLGVKTTDGMSMAGLTQVSVEGVEQLDLYYSSYLPQFFFAMIAPVILFLICVWIDWRTALVLIACVPLIPVSIVAVSKYAKKIFAKYWGKYTSMGDKFLDSVQGLKELKIFQADAAQHVKINESAEEFRVITMKVLVMQLASTTIMDLVAYGGAGVGIALAICGAAFWGLNPIAALFLCLVAVEFFLPLRAFGSAFHVAMNGASAGKKIISLLNAPDPEWGTEDVDGKEIKLTKDKNGVYFPDEKGSAIISTVDGVAIIKDLSDQKYTLREVTVPKGYVGYTEPIPFEMEARDTEDDPFPVTVYNSPEGHKEGSGAKTGRDGLPMWALYGGIGLLALAAGVGVLYLRKRKMN